MTGNRSILRKMPLVAVLAAVSAAAGAASGPESDSGGLVLRPVPQDGHGGGPPELSLKGADSAEVTIWRPDLKTGSPSGSNGRVEVASPFGNYHTVIAEREANGTVQTAIRYVYRHGRPSGHSPRELLGAVKAPLEVVPDPVPREHHQYMAGHEAPFVVRYRGSPVAGVPVTLRTANGTLREAETGPEGRVVFLLPGDFPDVKPGRGKNPPAEFTVSARHRAGGTDFATRLSAVYHVDPGNWQSLGWALALMGVGFLTGVTGTWWTGRKGTAREDAQ